VLFSSRVRVRIRFSVWLVSGYADVYNIYSTFGCHCTIIPVRIAQCLLNSCVKIFKGSRWLEIFYVVSDVENQHLMHPEFDGTRVSCLED